MKFDTPTLITLTAPTCSGKSFLLNMLTDSITPTRREFIKGKCERIVSTTTRNRRDGEEEGRDYHYISEEQSLEMEKRGEFAELIEFRGTRYGVTKAEMANKMAGARPPIVILEPKGLAIYEQMCKDNGWGIFKVFVTTPEEVRISRLIARTTQDISQDAANGYDHYLTMKHIKTHTNRMLSITGEERHWMTTNRWDAIIDGTDHVRAIADLKQGITWRNQRTAPPTPYHHV